MIYLDNAATSGRKPDCVYAAADHALRNLSGNPGRSGHSVSLAAGSAVESTRLKLAEFFGAEKASEISFTANATTALNTAILGTAAAGSHIITSSLEHNSVSRPLEYLKSLGSEVSVIPASLQTGVDPDDLKAQIRKNTSLVVLTHISNVTGTVNEIRAIGRLCRSCGIAFLVDAAQSAGLRRIHVQDDCIDMLAFPGHKGLFGPAGTGGLYIRSTRKVNPLTRGGTGTFSELFEQPSHRPDAFESGTLNVPGIAGLGAGLSFIQETGIENIRDKEQNMRRKLVSALKEIPGITLYAPSLSYDAGCVISFTLKDTEPSDIAMMLDASFDIAVRAGLHCSPWAHRMLGTLEHGGTVRVSPGYFNTEEELDLFISAVEELSAM